MWKGCWQRGCVTETRQCRKKTIEKKPDAPRLQSTEYSKEARSPFTNSHIYARQSVPAECLPPPCFSPINMTPLPPPQYFTPNMFFLPPDLSTDITSAPLFKVLLRHHS